MRGGTEPSPKSSRPSLSRPPGEVQKGLHPAQPPTPTPSARSTHLPRFPSPGPRRQNGKGGGQIEGLLLILRPLRKGLSGGIFLQLESLGPPGKVATETGGNITGKHNTR